MVRTHITALVALLTLFSANFVLAFGLGELTLKSYLNQPFEAEIELVEVGDLTIDEIIPKLATAKDFANVGLQRDFFLTHLEFEVVFDDKSGRNYVLITSADPVTEPFLDFLVEFLWPEGRLLREYTVLLDPPTYAAQAGQIQTVPVIAVNSEPKVETVIDSAETVESEQDVYQEIPDVASSSGESQGMAEPAANSIQSEQTRRSITTQSKDTLWSIAARERPVESVSVQQTMLAIQELNPDAFQHNNINYLKKNQVLRIPNENEIRSLAAREALGLVADQNREWAGRTLASGGTLPVDTAKLVGSRQVTPMAGGSAGEQMKLVADSEGEGEAVGTYSGEGSGANADEAMRSSRQSAQLLAEKKSLTAQVETSEKLISLKDQQIAELQARLAEQGEDTSTSMDDEVNNVVERVAVAEPEEEIEALESLSEEEEIEQALAQAKTDAKTVDQVGSDFAEETVELKDEEISFETKEVQEESIKPAADKPKRSPVVEEESSQTLLFVGLGVVVLLVLGGLGFFLYKRRVASAATSDDAFANNYADSEDGFGDVDGFEESDELSDDAFGGSDSDGENVLTEAETYISFNRHAQAVTLLKNAIEEGNDDIAVKIKLLEAYAGVGDRGAFDELSEQVLGEDATQQAMVDELASTMEGDSGQSFDMDATTRMNASDFDLDSNNEEEFDISLDDLANDLDASFSSDDNDDTDLGSLDLSEDALEDFEGSVDTQVLEADDSSDSLELDLDDTVVMEAGPAPVIEEDDGLELDLDELSFDDAEEVNQSDTLVLAAEEDDGLDLDFDMDDDLDFDSGDSDTSVPDDAELDTGLNLDDTDDEELDLDLGDELSFDEPEASLSSDDELDLGSDLELDDELSLDDDLSLEEDLNLDADDNAASDEDSLFAGGEDDFELPDDGDEAATKLDLARAYIDMGDEDGAKDILEEVIAEGDEKQKAEAKQLLAKL